MKPFIAKDNINLKGQDYLIIDKDIKDLKEQKLLQDICQKNFNWRR